MSTEYFYNEKNRKILSIPDSWSDAAKEMQRTFLSQNEFLPLLNYTPPKNEFPFEIVRVKVTPTEDKTAFEAVEERRAIKLRMSQEKLLEQPEIASKLPVLMAALQADEDLVDWWMNDMSYARGSVVAQKAMQVFGMTQEEMEKLALRCRG